MDVTICIGTFGDDHWIDLAEQRAIPSAEQFDVPVIHVHAGTLHEARNQAVAKAATEWVVHLDADDELEPGFVEAMSSGIADLRAPAVRYIRAGRSRHIWMPKVAGHRHECVGGCLPEGNWLVVGTAVRRSMVLAVGGWWPEPVYEDWSLWLRCWRAGASVEPVPGAVYAAHVRHGSRNRGPDRATKDLWHWRIRDSILGQEAAA